MVVYAMLYKVSAFGHSDIGLVRNNNEDYWSCLPEQHFFVLADGMGGHRAGEVASKESVAAMCDIVKSALGPDNEELTLEEMHGVIQLAIEQVNDIVHVMSKSNEDMRGMGTTLCCLYFHPQGLIYGHVGDSRIYRLRDGRLDQLTKDDSLVRELMEMGQIDDRVINEGLYKSIITKAIGTESYVEPSVHIADFSNHDIYLMCSDGLSDMLTLKEIEKILNTHKDVKKCVKALINAAKDKGGFDNVTVVLMKVQELHGNKDISR